MQNPCCGLCVCPYDTGRLLHNMVEVRDSLSNHLTLVWLILSFFLSVKLHHLSLRLPSIQFKEFIVVLYCILIALILVRGVIYSISLKWFKLRETRILLVSTCTEVVSQKRPTVHCLYHFKNALIVKHFQGCWVRINCSFTLQHYFTEASEQT